MTIDNNNNIEESMHILTLKIILKFYDFSKLNLSEE